MKALALDLGEKRIGVAVSDSGGLVALPYGVIERRPDPAVHRREVASLVAESRAEVVVVGLPLSLSGRAGPAASAASAEAEELAALLEVPVELFDERLTTVEAARRRQELDAAARRAGRRRPRRGRPREAIDAEAAAVLLEAWLRRGARR